MDEETKDEKIASLTSGNIQLLDLLEKRDATIAALRARVEELEGKES